SPRGSAAPSRQRPARSRQPRRAALARGERRRRAAPPPLAQQLAHVRRLGARGDARRRGGSGARRPRLQAALLRGRRPRRAAPAPIAGHAAVCPGPAPVLLGDAPVRPARVRGDHPGPAGVRAHRHRAAPAAPPRLDLLALGGAAVAAGPLQPVPPAGDLPRLPLPRRPPDGARGLPLGGTAPAGGPRVSDPAPGAPGVRRVSLINKLGSPAPSIFASRVVLRRGGKRWDAKR
ncbi:hypothetical protein EG877_16315, partial [Enterococcus faecalis]